ncbi:hypothetical protein [Halalkalicoccus subterraneus]|uniref:hypothetical protein n=1 Tax=Halalkalicoccus subterraneus TaxID=2675002 RepID=UPI000EFCA95C|nr:hypothetical protein [Halalkalicoccus subterraneus]
MPRSPSFRETQRMRQPWVWLLLGAIVVVTIPVGSIPALVVLAAVAALFFAIRLTTEVREDGVYVRFGPIHRTFRHVPFDDVERVETTRFGLLSYGGIGIRWTPDTIAYMTDRGDGIEIHRANAKSVVIGSQRADELAAAISAATDTRSATHAEGG